LSTVAVFDKISCMVKAKAQDIKKKVQKQDEEVYGTGTVSSSDPDPEIIQEETTKELVEDVIGNKPKSGKEFNIGEEVNKDEEDILTKK
jgi:hypothetical protein